MIATRTLPVDTALLTDQPQRPAGCTRCSTVMLVPPARLGTCCLSCGRGRVAARDIEVHDTIPEKLLPFSATEADVHRSLTALLSPLRFRPRRLTVPTLMANLTRVYFPCWLIDTELVGSWSAEVGFAEIVQSSIERIDDSGHASVLLHEEKLHWEPRAGLLWEAWHNIRLPAYQSAPLLQRWLGPFDARPARAYDATLLEEDAVIRLPDVSPEDAWDRAGPAALTTLAAAECQKATGGTGIRSFAMDAEPRFEGCTWLYVPLYVTHYTDDRGDTHLIYVHGQTAKARGALVASRRAARRQAAVLILCAVLPGLVSLLVGLMSVLGRLPPFAILIAAMMLLGSGIPLIAALSTLTRPSGINRTQRHLIPPNGL